jgi:hypothetical protein
MKIIALTAIIIAATAGTAIAQQREGLFDQYFVRSDSITVDAGNAKEVNAAIHVIDPWPRRAADRRIPANGARMSGAIQHYRSNSSPGGQSSPTTGAPQTFGASPSANTSQPGDNGLTGRQ